MTTKQIKTIAQLKKILKKHGNASYLDFAITLNGGGFSRKEIMLGNDNLFYINNCIDDIEQELTDKELMDKECTNIGTAIKLGAFYQIIN